MTKSNINRKRLIELEDSLEKESKKKFRFKERFKKIVKNRFVVLASLFVLISTVFVGINRASADSNYDLSMTYQYFLLCNKDGYGGNDDKALKSSLGFLGSGGNQGTFNYNEIVEGAGKNNQYEAKKFSSMMATLSGYHYIATRTQSIQSAIGSGLEHFFIGLILVVFGFIADLASSIWSTLITVIADYNIFGLLGAAFGGSPAGQKLASALGVSTNDIKNVASLGLGLATVILVGTIIWALRRGGTNPDHGALQKARNRALCIVGMPAIICVCAMILSNAAPDIAGKNNTPVFAKYLINVRDWALKDNFDLGVAGMSSIKAGNSDGTYIDTDYNPYGGGKAANIGDSLYKQNESSGAFPNTTLAMEYFRNSTFNSSDYLSEIESAPASQTNSVAYALSHWFNTKSDSTKAKVSNVLSNMKLYDFATTKIPISSYGTTEYSWMKDKAMMGPSPMEKASGDYVLDGGKTQLTGMVQTWIDRYIYGAKHTGDIKDYYKAGPSLEQIYSGAGGTLTNGNGLRLSDESTFLALNTSFTPTGGTFSISGPAFGAYADIAKFDSVNPLYSDVSMVGVPIFTVPKMLAEVLIMILIALAIITAFWSMGIVEMNLLPFRAWLKGVFLGDLEYAEAAIIYALGIAGTIVILCVVPQLLDTALYGIISAVFTPLTGNLQMNSNGTPSVNGTEMIGIAGWGVFLIAAFGIVAFFKMPKFRNGLIELLTIPWTWARDKGQKLEDMAAGGSGSFKEVLKKNHEMRMKKNAEHNDKLKDFAGGNSRQAQKLNKWTGGLSSKAARKILGAKQAVGEYHPDDEDGTLTPKDALARDLEQSRISSELGNDMSKMKPKDVNKNVNDAVVDEVKDLNKKPFEPDENGMLPVDDPRLTPEEQAKAEEINKEQQALDDEQAQIDADRETLERQHENGEISDKEYEKGIEELDKRQAEHDRKQAALDGNRMAMIDAVNGTASLDKNGKFDPNNPNFTPAQREEAKEINKEQTEIDKEQDQIDHEKEELQKQLDSGEIGKDEYDKGMEDLDKRQDELNQRQESLDQRKSQLQEEVSQNNPGRTVKVSDLQSQAQTAKALAEETRGAIKAYQKNPTPQTAKTVVDKLNAMEKQAQAMGTTSKELYGFDAKARANEIAHSKFMPEQMNGNAFRVEDNPDGTQTILTNGNGGSTGSGSSSRLSGNTSHSSGTARVTQLKRKQPTLTGKNYKTNLASDSTPAQDQQAPVGGQETVVQSSSSNGVTQNVRPQRTSNYSDPTQQRTSSYSGSTSRYTTQPSRLGRTTGTRTTNLRQNSSLSSRSTNEYRNVSSSSHLSSNRPTTKNPIKKTTNLKK